MRYSDPSFAKGEISPLIHARVDLSAFQTGLALCENFIVLPQGGVTRRPGWVRHEEWGTWKGSECPVRLMPFIYSTADSMVLVFQNLQIKAISASCLPDERGRVYDIYNTPYTIKQAKELRFVQSGNVIFLTHGDHPVKKMERFYDSGIRFRLSDLTYRGGPWTTDERDTGLSGVEFRYIGKQQGKLVLKASEDFFTQDDVGRLFELNYNIHDKTVELRAQKGKVYDQSGNWVNSADTVYSKEIEVGSEWYFQTYDRWEGTITLQRLPIGADASDNNAWEDWRPHNRPNADDVGNAQLSGSEEEGPAYYRMKFKIDAGTARATLTRSGFTRTDRFKLIEMEDSKTMFAEYQVDPNSIYTSPYPYKWTSDWRIGSWGGGMGYPSAVAIFQDRLVLAATKSHPQSIWMSRTGDYQDFSTTTGNLKDDDAIDITLSARDMSGIHSLHSGADLIAFTSSDEWRIKGAGDSGAITPTAIVAHKQTSIGSCPIQPFDANGIVILAQTHKGEIHTFRYTFELDGYQGSNLSILSEHMFRRGKEVVDMCYQQIPDSQIWFVCADGTAACCTFEMEHQVVGWHRHVTDGRIGCITCVPRADGYDEVWAAIERDGVWAIETLSDRRPEQCFNDNGKKYMSAMATLRMPPQGETFQAKKYIPRLAVYAVHSAECRVSPATDATGKRWRVMRFAPPLGRDTEYDMVSSDIQLDSGFERHAGVRIWIEDEIPLTILGISPEMVAGGS